jgi:hypothetical protein
VKARRTRPSAPTSSVARKTVLSVRQVGVPRRDTLLTHLVVIQVGTVS